jgi:DNA-binding Xre family transcriptional regulator
MIRSRFEELRHQKEEAEGRRLSVRTIAAEVKVSNGTIQRMKKGELDRIYISTLDKLCRYFGVKQVGDLIEYIAADIVE